MLGPTAPGVSQMRMRSTIEDLSPGLQDVGSGHAPMRKLRDRRLFSDINGSLSPGQFSNLNSQDGSFHRAGSFVAE